MNLVTKYLLGKYLKYFFIILLSLELFFIGIDFLQNVKNMPNSANLQLLYLLYNGFFTLTITLPLSLIFAWITTLTVLVRNNELVSFYALGISQKQVLFPIVNISVLITLVLISLQTTPLAYSYEEKKKILENEYFVNVQSDIFLKYNEYFVYFKELYPMEKKAYDIHIFKTQGNDIVQTITGEKAYYQNNKWYVINTKITNKPSKIDWNNSKLEVNYEKFLYTLEGFEPKIITNVNKGNAPFSIIDAVRAMILLDDKDFNTDKIKAILYSQIVIPFFIVPLIVIIFLYTTVSNRFFNAPTFVSISIFFTLIVWGVIFVLQKLSLGGVIIAEVATVLPIVLLYLVSYYLYMRKVK